MPTDVTDSIQPVRGCGRRLAGDVYAVTEIAAGGEPVESFLVDSPQPVDPSAFGIKAPGITLVEMQDDEGTPVFHVLDWVGACHYPSPADFVEEARRFGVSRKVPVSTCFAKLSPKSRLILLHPRAWIANADRYYAARTIPLACVKGRPDHDAAAPGAVMCASLWWEDVGEGQSVDPADPACRDVVRTMPAFAYTARRAPYGVTPEHKVAIFASFPIHALHVVEDPKGGRHKTGVARASRSGLPVIVTSE